MFKSKRSPHKEIRNECVNKMWINSRHCFSKLGTVRSNQGGFGTRSQHFSFNAKLARCLHAESLAQLLNLCYKCSSYYNHVKDTETTLTKEIKNTTAIYLKNRYSRPDMDILLDMCSFIDPQYKQLYSLNDGPVKLVISEIESVVHESSSDCDKTSCSHIGEKGERLKQQVKCLFCCQ